MPYRAGPACTDGIAKRAHNAAKRTEVGLEKCMSLELWVSVLNGGDFVWGGNARPYKYRHLTGKDMQTEPSASSSMSSWSYQ